jgi:hypothetical protein
MRNTLLKACVLSFLGALPAYALDQMVSYVPNAEKVGEGRLSYMIWDVYDATLYAPDGSWRSDQPFALQLSYLRDIAGKKIADRSVEEMRVQGFTDEVRLADWHTQMRSIFPDVSEGFILTGIFISSGETIFYENNREIGRIKDPEFGHQFFNIWLSPRTSAPDLRRKLLGQS